MLHAAQSKGSILFIFDAASVNNNEPVLATLVASSTLHPYESVTRQIFEIA